MGKLLIKKKTEEQVCHDFDQFLPLYAVVKDYWNGIPRTRVRVPVEMHVFHISSNII